MNPVTGVAKSAVYLKTRDEEGHLQEIEILRLKDKLGTRKVPTAELMLRGTPAVPARGLTDGVRNIVPMLQLTRTWNSVTAAAFMRRGLALARLVNHAQWSLDENLLNISASEVHLSKSLMNLVANAADAMPGGGEITIRTANRYIDRPYPGFERIPIGEYSVLEVTDVGIGMAPCDLEHIFEPFYTKKSMGRSGSGLGMSVAWGTLRDHDGYIDIRTEEGHGTSFRLFFPVTRSEKEMAAAVHIEDYIGREESILVVDDSSEQRTLAQHMLQRLGYTVSTANSGEDALAAIHGQDFDLLVPDMIMPPGWDGLETFQAIRQHNPRQRAIIASGYSETARVHEMQRLGAGGYVKKPYTLEKIGLAVRKELDRPPIASPDQPVAFPKQL